MATRRKEVPALDSNRSTNRSRVVAVKTKTAFKWKQHEWMLRKQIQDDVQVLRNRITSSVLIVKKVFQLHKSDNYGKHFEVKVLEMLPECNRVVNMLAYAHACPDIYHGTALFEYCPLGDLSDWKKAEFDHKNFKPVPEAYIWRFFIQMSQALAFIHNSLGPNQESRHCLLHRDIKPKNILVVHNGTTYPSFKLHDFGCGTFDTPENRQKSTYCGTFDWQPPENPKINTPYADIWALGACVHYLAVGKAPIWNTADFEQQVHKQLGGHPAEVKDYKDAKRYYAAKAPRVVTPINLTKAQQTALGIAPRNGKYNPVYSNELNAWMCHTLEHSPKRRPKASALVSNMVPEGKAMLALSSGAAGLIDLEIKFPGWAQSP